MTKLMTFLINGKKRVIKDGIYIINGYKGVISEHTGMSLMAGAVFLKSGSMLNSLMIVAPGYVILVSVVSLYIKNWRDKDE